jgi:hypothetical protein
LSSEGVFVMAERADYGRLTDVLQGRQQDVVTLSWRELDEIVGGLPRSAVKHHPQWWHGERSHTSAWRRAGFQLDSVDLERSVTFRRTDTVTDRPVAAQPRSGMPAQQVSGMSISDGAGVLGRVAPGAVLLVIGCSASKARGGQPAPVGEAGGAGWPRELMGARAHVLAESCVDDRLVMPAWQRYTGHFYRQAGDTLRDATAGGRLVIISGGYGLIRGDEPIAYYDRRLRLADWPPGLLERALCDEARRVGAATVLAFVARASEYAQLLRRIRWRDVGIEAAMVSVRHEGGGALREVPQRLGQAFSAFWRQVPADYPPGLIVEELR